MMVTSLVERRILY